MANPELDTFFFQQPKVRSFSRRYRKAPEDLPQDLRFAHLNPRIAAYLASKEKEKIAEELGSDLGSKSLLPQINQTVSLIRSRLDSFLSTDEDAQRQLFEGAKLTANTVIAHLAKILYLFEGIKPNIPRTLEIQLLHGWQDLTADVHVIHREWQLPQSKEEYLRKVEQRTNSKSPEPDSQSLLGGRPGSSVGSTRADGDDQSKSAKDSSQSDSQTKSVRVRSKVTSRNLGLTDISEDKEDLGGTPRDMLPSACASRTACDSSIINSRKDATRSERTSSGKLRRRADKQRPSSGLGGRDQPSYWAVIQFQLSSKTCQDKGWILNPATEEEAEHVTILEWASQRLRAAIKLKKEQAAIDNSAGYDTALQIRYYGDSRKDQIDKFKRHGSSRRASAVAKGEKPIIPDMQTHSEGKNLLAITTTDGAVTVYYPSGRVAIITSKNSSGRQGFYTMVYDDNAHRTPLASFTPSGRGCCHHSNGNVSFLSTDSGGTLADNQGAVQKRWKWPNNGTKLSTPINVVMNSYITLRCYNLQHMTLHFNCQKEITKVSLGTLPGSEILSAREEMECLVSGLQFTSQTAKELLKNSKNSALKTQQKKNKGLRAKSKSPLPQSDLMKIIDFPEQTENDPDADKELYKLQRKVRNLVDSWLEHYRIAIGITSPDLKNLSETPLPRKRFVQSAKSSPGGGGVVIIERESTKVPLPGVVSRVPSAPAGVSDRMERFLSDAVKSTQTRVTRNSGHHVDRPPSASNQNTPPKAALTNRDKVTQHQSVVQFSSKDEAIEVEQVSVTGSIPVSTDSNIPSANMQSFRSKSAPLRLAQTSLVNPCSGAIGLCPVAVRQGLLGEERLQCHCSRHKIPNITDVEFDEFIQHQAPEKQLVIIAIVSSLYPVSGHIEMLEEVYSERNRNKARPCVQSRQDPYRILLYDMATAADCSTHAQPLLLRRHNVLPGMFLMYEGGRLVFCDHILNGYGIGRKDLQKQLLLTRRAASLGKTLPQDFRFSPQKGRSGSRSAWGGEIGGAGVDRYGSPGLTIETEAIKRVSCDSVSSEESYGHVSYDRQIRLTLSADPVRRHVLQQAFDLVGPVQ